MRFRREEKFEKRGVTPRRLSAAKRALQKEVDTLPLFAAQIKADQPTPEERVLSFDDNYAVFVQKRRDAEALQWKRARAQLRQLPIEEKESILKYWNESGMPATSVYFATTMHRYTEQGWRPEL